MSVVASPQSITLAIFPTARGFGWTAFASPFALVGSGLFTEFRHKNDACLNRIARLLAEFEPETVVLEAFEGHVSKRCGRVRLLSRSIKAMTTDRGHDVAIYSRADVLDAFAETGAVTRDQVAAAVARNVPALAHRLPQPRAPYDSEDKRLALFNAAALVLTHYRNGATALLDELRDAA